MAVCELPSILLPEDGLAAEVLNLGAKVPVCLVCEHASAFIPSYLEGLGIGEADRFSHAVWDIGAFDLSVRLSELLDAPLVASRVSRVVFDCNRPPDATDATPAITETIAIPGNAGIEADHRALRVRDVYEPFHAQVSDVLDKIGSGAVLVTIHSFTPQWFGVQRDVELGILHDSDDRLARRMFAAAVPEIITRMNEPYSASDGVTHTLALHGIPRGIENVMIEVRNDLLSDPQSIERMAGILASMIRSALSEKAEAS